MKKNIKTIQSIISSILAFLLTLVFVSLFILTGLYFGVFNNRIILSKVNESNYYNEVYEELHNRAEEIIKESGLPLQVLSEVITLERVYIGGKYYIEDTLMGREPLIQTDKVRSQLEQNVNQYLKEEGITRTKELDAGIEEILNKVVQEYRRGIQFQFINYIAEYKASFMNLFRIAVPVLVLIAGIIGFSLVKLHNYIHKGVRYIAYAMIASTSMIIISSAILFLSKIYDRIEQIPDYYDRFLTNYLKWDIQVFLYLGGIGVLLSLLLIFLIRYLKRIISNR